VKLEGLGQLKKSTSLGLELATFRLVAPCLNQLRYRVPHQPGKTEENHEKFSVSTVGNLAEVRNVFLPNMVSTNL
jgi:hypothetical protein